VSDVIEADDLNVFLPSNILTTLPSCDIKDCPYDKTVQGLDYRVQKVFLKLKFEER
jgi:hypothetical protein